MEHVLDLYEKPYDPHQPVICFDEKSKQLLEDTRVPLPMKSGKSFRRDYEYKRNGIRNIFLAVEPKAGFRTTSITERRTKTDFAHEIERIISLPRYAQADQIHVVLDNLNTHRESSLIETFGMKKARQMMHRIRFHHTPKHGSWLNMAEIELSILGRQCVNRRIPAHDSLAREIGAWEKRRNGRQNGIQWKFTKADARNVFRYRVAELS